MAINEVAIFDADRSRLTVCIAVLIHVFSTKDALKVSKTQKRDDVKSVDAEHIKPSKI